MYSIENDYVMTYIKYLCVQIAYDIWYRQLGERSKPSLVSSLLILFIYIFIYIIIDRFIYIYFILYNFSSTL